MRQVGYLQGSYQDARSTKQKISIIPGKWIMIITLDRRKEDTFDTFISTHRVNGNRTDRRNAEISCRGSGRFRRSFPHCSQIIYWSIENPYALYVVSRLGSDHSNRGHYCDSEINSCFLQWRGTGSGGRTCENSLDTARSTARSWK